MGRGSQPNKRRWPIYMSFGIILTLVILFFTVPDVNMFFVEAWNVLTSNNQQKIKAWAQDFGWLGPVVLILAMIVQMFLIFIPSILLMVVSILSYGPIWGSLIVFASVFAASNVGYFIGKHLASEKVMKLLGKSSEKKVEHFLKDYGIWSIIVTRINPFLSNDAISFVAGLLKMKYWKFISATLIGIAPLTIIIAIYGNTYDKLKNALLWISIGGLILLVAYILWDKNLNKN